MRRFVAILPGDPLRQITLSATGSLGPGKSA